MAKYDQGGGCACGLMKVCDCEHNMQADGTRPRKVVLKPKPKPTTFGDIFAAYDELFMLVKERHNYVQTSPDYSKGTAARSARELWEDGLNEIDRKIQEIKDRPIISC